MGEDLKRPCLTHELDWTGKIFGFKRTKRKPPTADLITLYTEDDGMWHPSKSFDAAWIKDFVALAQAIDA